MKLTVADYLDQLSGEKTIVTETETTASKVQQKSVLKKAIEAVIDALDTGHLGKYQITIRVKKGDPVIFHLDTNLINIPMAEAERLDGKLLDKEISYPVNLYMVMESEDVNKSGLRIDELANETDLSGDPEILIKRLQEWLAEHLADIMEARA
ncbi:hypothetical protein [Limosilactobacillus fastidiosus]|uniref:Uncharacterized protein n=1 Tax=Limosilactobacillus fastidiosus TaxID=2759855 RepID=A0A7W3TZD8_9LACO|nr:hypothetical protein [Limosilactobacillus fastidiosus]MBB1063498.1 hypothetical protein [Limosilactobacillus fastidiosus]MBB1085810.1 hypothetical protein [Limosilactobacillus fastidiosus]MCD7084766.1 hypothetical protein [Limosilactobacillus fastidiosus]MCD7085853.1 hypothetical protein [Limosilactobacillus fastidiosus]MCD7113930.1 hypothetical protein [Limosilactobacillus fastidiosus]